MQDYYQLLGIKKSASEEEIKKAYRRLAHEHHPDRPGGNEKKFKEINEAYQTLSNREKRAQYDRFGRVFSGMGGGPFGGAQGKAGPGFGDFSGFSAGGGQNSGWDFGNINFDEFGDLTDIFESFFGGMGVKKRKTYRRGADLRFTAEITLEDAYRGVTKEINFRVQTICATCAGLGYFAKEGTKACETCNGRGEVKEVRSSFFGSFQQVRPCEKCFGTGQIPNKVCVDCKGRGRVQGEKKLSIEIVPGVMDGQLIKVTGAGEAGERGAATGDLYIEIAVMPNKVFARKGDDLFVRKSITPLQILLGKKIEVQTISGEKLGVEIPAGHNVAEKLRLAGQGMPRFGSHGHGDLYLDFEIRAPKKLSAKAKKILEELEGEFE